MPRKVILRRPLAAAAMLAVFAVLAWWVGPKLRRGPEAPQPGDVSLLLVERVSHFDGPFRLVRVTFRDGQVLPPETLWEDHDRFFKRTIPITRAFVHRADDDWEDDDWTDDDPIFDHSSFYHVIDNRFVVTRDGGVFDVIEGQVLHRGPGRLIEVDGQAVVHGMRKNPRRNKYPVWENVTAFDLRTRRAERRDDPKY
ncbi:MAG TPA: hypothetical protein VKE74_14015, partial [Gemmataceae bacterium]|nr:hypothetical protein [Gemmataceae bacterium]